MDGAQGPRQEQRFQAESGRMTGAAGGPLESRAQLGQPQAPRLLPCAYLRKLSHVAVSENTISS